MSSDPAVIRILTVDDHRLIRRIANATQWRPAIRLTSTIEDSSCLTRPHSPLLGSHGIGD